MIQEELQVNDTVDLTKGFDLKNWSLEHITENALDYGLKALSAIFIIAIGFWLANKLAELVNKSLNKSGMTISMRKFLTDLFKIMFKVLVILVAISTAGFKTTGILAVLGGLAVGVGMALQGSLSNLAGGILILLFKPFKVGDTIKALDKIGTVEEISVLQTILLTPDMRTVILPNGSVFNNAIENYSTYGIRRVEVGIGIGYDDDFNKAKEVLMEVFKNEPLMLDDKGYVLEINEFGDNSVNLAMYGYTRTSDYLQAKWNLNKAAKEALDANGINIPYPQRDLHIVSGLNNLK